MRRSQFNKLQKTHGRRYDSNNLIKFQSRPLKQNVGIAWPDFLIRKKKSYHYYEDLQQFLRFPFGYYSKITCRVRIES